ncbi:MAG: ABC transporter permease [Pseudomonadota bacterium]
MKYQRRFEYGPDCEVSILHRNYHDLVNGLQRRRLVFKLGVTEIAQRYRNTYLGPLWMTISLAVFLTILGYVGGALFNLELRDYLPYLCLGVVTWTFISAVVSESGQLFVTAPISTVVYDVPMSTFVYSFITRHLLLFAHNLLLYLLIAAYFGINFLPYLHFAILGMVILIIFSIGVTLSLAVICVRMRDIPQIVSNLLQVSFFATPIMWNAQLLADRGRKMILDLNPFYYLIEIVRAPLLGQEVDPMFYAVATSIALLTLLFGVAIYVRYKHRVMFYR